jgi:hypothetical protein
MINFPIDAVIADPSSSPMSLLIGPSREAWKSWGLKLANVIFSRSGVVGCFDSSQPAPGVRHFTSSRHVISNRTSFISKIKTLALSTNVIFSPINQIRL